METIEPKAGPAKSETSRQRNPWLWVPSLYFSQGIPYVIVMTMSVTMYKRLGVSNTDITLYTSLLYLPWVIKPLWSPLVDITRTKRMWVVTMQFLIAGGLGLVAAAVPTTGFFTLTLALFWVMAMASATHDIAADGFYMLSMSKHEQAWWVGIRSTFYRTAMIVGSGLLVVLAGVLESKNGLPPLGVPVQAVAQAAGNFGVDPASIKPETQTGPLQLTAWPASLNVAMTNTGPAAAKAAIAQAKAWNLGHGFTQQSVPEAKSSSAFAEFWQAHVSDPLGHFLSAHFPKNTGSSAVQAGNVGTFYLTLNRPPDPGRNVTVNIDRKKSGLEYFGLAKGDKGFRLAEGDQLVFNAANWNQPAAVAIQLDPKLKGEATVQFLAVSGNIPLAWSITLFVVAGLFLGFSIWHSFMLPRPANDGPVVGGRSLAGEFFATFGAFFKKPGVLMALAFILFYRFDEAQLGKIISPFLLDTRDGGGIGLTTSQLGLAYGTFGIAALTCGGLAGGFAAAKYGLKRMLPIMVGAMYLPKLVFIFLSYTQPENFLTVCGAVAVEQFGYGFGFTAFMLYMLYFADGPHKTAHYAICTGFMALGMMVPGMWSGWLEDHIGYRHFFVWVICSALPGLFIALQLKIDPQFGKK
jgi:MFS transporter, PAT family, beta-lactamase induction signal transducer AmpG